MKLGTSYYPELVDRNEWARDLDLMKSASLSIIRMLEFAWSALEPREGEYDFEWLDEFLDLAHSRGFQVILGTPTATPPVWLLTQYPEVLVVTRDGRRRTPGGRRDCDSDSFIFREFCVEIAQQLGRRYGNHPAVIGWQIDNELVGQESAPPEIHTPDAQFHFRRWLKKKYGSVKILNEAWGTRFWSGEFSDWGEVTTPQNPRSTMAHVLDYGRYFTASQVEFIRLQYDALRKVIEHRQWITHNSTGVFSRGIDHVDYMKAVDVAGWDAYYGAAGNPLPEAYTALAHDLFRTAKRAPFWVFETNGVQLGKSTNAAFWGEMVARGAEAIIFWHWREHRAGAENRSQTVCDYDGRPKEACLAFLREFAARPELQLKWPKNIDPAQAAFVFSEDEVRAENSPDPYKRWPVPYMEIAISAYEPMRRLGLPTDMIRPFDDFSPYKLVVLPSCRIFDADWAGPITEWVRGGGVLFITAKAAQQDGHGVYHKIPGLPLRELLGFEVRTDVPLSQPLTLRFGDDVFSSLLHAEKIEAIDLESEILARFESGDLKGEIAALRRSFGKGEVFYAAANSRDLNEKLVRMASKRAGLEILETEGDLVRYPHLTDPNIQWIFNYSHEPHEWNKILIPARDFRCATKA